MDYLRRERKPSCIVKELDVENIEIISSNSLKDVKDPCHWKPTYTPYIIRKDEVSSDPYGKRDGKEGRYI